MPFVIETSSLGLQVELGKIDKELKKLWEQNESATRASLINLAIYSEEPNSLEKNTELMTKITEDHACRAIVICVNGSAKENRVEAWINAHCHVGRAGSKQICSEQISFLLEGASANFLPNIVFSHLESDLPFYLWWQGDLHDPMDPQLWAWVDRFIFDSKDWRDFNQQFRLVEAAQREAKERLVLCDLNWTRLDKIRYALAQFFDHPASHHHFAEMESVNVFFAQGFKSTAKLLIGWLAAQLKWKMNEPARNGSCRLLDSNGHKIDIELREEAGEYPISQVVLRSGGIEFTVKRAECGDLLEVSRHGPHERPAPQLMPAQVHDQANLISQELMRGGAHRIYLHAVNCVRDLL
jgi:glucose-6-phosphate dehydrogenase assembly protein OpcA